MNHVGTKTIQTERLVLRAFKESDAEQAFRNWTNDPMVTEYLRWNPHGNVELTKKLCKSWEEESKSLTNYQWVIELKENHEVVGSISLYDINESRRSGELGYCLSHKCWGKGIVPEALAALLKVFENVGFVRIYATCKVMNTNSVRVLEKCGFEFEGILRKFGVDNQNNLVDAKMFSKILNA